VTSTEGDEPRVRQSHIFAREELEHYVEEKWCSARLFDVELFEGQIVDPACGWGTIVINAHEKGYEDAVGFDIVDRGFGTGAQDFLKCTETFNNIVTNPPFNLIEQFTIHAVQHSLRKTAVICPVSRLPAAHWLKGLHLARVWLMTPRPSMPPGHYIAAGGKVGGGRVDYAWLVFERGYVRAPHLNWLHRDEVYP